MDISEAINVARQVNKQFRAFKMLEDMLLVAGSLEAAVVENENRLNGLKTEIDKAIETLKGFTGDLPQITCSPSIVVEGYHGFLRAGEFTADIEGRGERGIARAVSE